MFGLTPWDEGLPPDFTNDKGIKWWIDKQTTRDAQHKLGGDAAVWYVEEVSGRKTRLLTENGEIEHDDQSLEGMLCHIDILRLS